MNITEFAQYAGVSKAAVSRYFNGGYLSADKRARIEAAVEATGYHPSIQAQMLRTRRTRQIGVIMPRLSSESCARMVEGISRVLDEQGYQRRHRGLRLAALHDDFPGADPGQCRAHPAKPGVRVGRPPRGRCDRHRRCRAGRGCLLRPGCRPWRGLLSGL